MKLKTYQKEYVPSGFLPRTFSRIHS